MNWFYVENIWSALHPGKRFTFIPFLTNGFLIESPGIAYVPLGQRVSTWCGEDCVSTISTSLFLSLSSDSVLHSCTYNYIFWHNPEWVALPNNYPQNWRAEKVRS